MNHWVILPVLGPLLIALALMVWQGRRGRLMVLAAGFAGETALVVWLFRRSLLGGMETYQPGNLLPPAGTVLVLDQLAALMLLVIAALGAAASARCLADPQARNRSDHPALIQIALAGLNGAVLAGGMFTLWSVWALALAALTALAPALRPQALTGAALLLMAVAVSGHLVPTLTLADLAERQAGSLPGQVLLSASFALFFWQPRAAPAALTALFRLVAVAVLSRLILLLPPSPWPLVMALVFAIPVMRQPGQRLQVTLCLLALGGCALGSEAEIAAGLAALCAAAAVALIAPTGDRPPGLVFQALCLTGAAGLMLLATDHWPVRLALLAGIPALALATGLAIRRGPVHRLRPRFLLAATAIIAAIVALGKPAGTHLATIARQLHNRQDYTTAVMGLPENQRLPENRGLPAPTKGMTDAPD